jgi:hypothetical protein
MDEPKLRKGYTGYELTSNARSELLAHVNPVHPDVVAHHITHEYGVYEQLPPYVDMVRVIAVAQNDLVQAAIVKINGTTTRVYGDSFYHITVSVDRAAGGKAVDSNALIKDSKNWTAIDPFNLAVMPKFFNI